MNPGARRPPWPACLLAVAAFVGAAVAQDAAPPPAALPPAAASPAPPPPSAGQLDQWIRDLASPDFATREAATERLVDAGDAAVPLLKDVQTDDAEVQARVRIILEGGAPANHAWAAETLKQLVTHQAVWRVQDTDKNGMADYWTRDVAGLHAVRDANGKAIAFINIVTARADAAPAFVYPELRAVTQPASGYFLRALITDQDDSPYVPAKNLAAATAVPANGICTNPARFGFCAWPARYGRDGRLTFFVSEDGVVWKKDLGPDAKGIDAHPRPDAPDSGWTQAGGDAAADEGDIIIRDAPRIRIRNVKIAPAR